MLVDTKCPHSAHVHKYSLPMSHKSSTTHDRIVTCCLPKPTKSKISLSKERSVQEVGLWATCSICGHQSRVCPLPSVSVISVHLGPSPPPPDHPPHTRSQTLPTNSLVQHIRGPSRARKFALSTSILGAWTQPWNFTSLGGIEQASVLSFSPASHLHKALSPFHPQDRMVNTLEQQQTMESKPSSWQRGSWEDQGTKKEDI